MKSPGCPNLSTTTVCVCSLRDPFHLPAECPEPGQLIGAVNSVADGDDFLEALDLHRHDLSERTVNRRGVNDQTRFKTTTATSQLSESQVDVKFTVWERPHREKGAPLL